MPQVETEEILPEEPVVARRTDVVPELSEVQKTPEVQEIVKEPETQKVPEASQTQEIHEVTASAPAAPVAPVTPAAPVEPPKGTGRCVGTGIRRSDQPGNAGGREH